ncbi:hypothetical protein VC83_07661 [Pseudogymnoascus destructans]|uniref:Uncharacterized protein n=1 Tax=Pseudogymnoascus destructans TaxID=655981 RepID=A0A177A1T3_9PEZI|nr:uncharacterized protein VC83_07661 [Pseudogymnoascus destructans]OAF55550.1 hypothetical protein VC83_07661 [Pseudogymnoascus destructans]
MNPILPLPSRSSTCLAICASSSAFLSSALKFLLLSTSSSSFSLSSIATLSLLILINSLNFQAACSASGSRPSVSSISSSASSSSSQFFFPASLAATSFLICSSTISSAAFFLLSSSSAILSSSGLVSSSFLSPRLSFFTNIGRIITLLGASSSLLSSPLPLSSSLPSSSSSSPASSLSVTNPSSSAFLASRSSSTLRSSFSLASPRRSLRSTFLRSLDIPPAPVNFGAGPLGIFCSCCCCCCCCSSSSTSESELSTSSTTFPGLYRGALAGLAVIRDDIVVSRLSNYPNIAVLPGSCAVAFAPLDQSVGLDRRFSCVVDLRFCLVDQGRGRRARGYSQ